MNTRSINLFALGTVAVLALSALPANAQVAPVDNRASALRAADHLLDVQFADGSFPWVVGQGGKFQNVQGITAIALLDAYTLSLDADYLGDATSGARGTRNWLANYLSANPANRLSASNVYFLAKFATVTGELNDLDVARTALARSVAFYGSGTGIAQTILQVRENQGHTNLGVWDVAFFVRAAQDVGDLALADEIAAVLMDQVTNKTIVDPFNAAANWYELGLSGLLFGLGEADFVGAKAVVDQARAALLAAQCDNGSFPTTWQGTVYCDDVQATAYAVLGLTHALGVVEAQSGCDYLRTAQGTDGSFDLGGYEIAEITAEAASALVACVLPAHNGATSYADAAVALLPPDAPSV